MNASNFLDLLLTWSAQICVLVAFGVLAALTLTNSRARLLFWQGLLLILLVLPLVEPWRPARPEEKPTAIVLDSRDSSLGRTIVLPHRHRWSSVDALELIALGATLRLVWIAAGFVRLRRYRRESRRLSEPPVPFGRISARWYLHDNLPGPVTYGLLKPSILLPARFTEMEPALQEAIACHELIHVSRHDWLFVLGEEFVRSAFWFHPAVWLVLSRIQLAREQVVDREVVRLTGDRDHYLDALVAAAAEKIQSDFFQSGRAPAPLFLKKRHFAKRVAAVLQEVSMSRSRIFSAFATICAAALLAARISISLIPFSLPAQMLPDDPGIIVETGAKLLHRTPLHFPAGVTARGTVTMQVSLGPEGDVTDARVVAGPLDLRATALATVLNWHFQAGPSPAEVRIQFGNEGAPVPVSASPSPRATLAISGSRSASALPPGYDPIFRVDPSSAVAAFPAVLKGITVRGLSTEAEQELRDRLPVSAGDTVRMEDLPVISKAVGDFDKHLRMTTQIGQNGDLQLLVTLTYPSLVPSEILNSSAEIDFPPTASGIQRIRVDGNVQAANLTLKVSPKYPLEAKQSHTQGVTRFAALIGTDGAIQKLRLVSGPPVLADAATEALKQWVYRPTVLNGTPVEVLTQIDVNFTLRD